ncbi:MAG: DUF11 domain-containing protein [Candidatus Aureabacteria bacterium]|nr:DUF11 domain-containing protein [Candidatus Auribacterota bacterium]
MFNYCFNDTITAVKKRCSNGKMGKYPIFLFFIWVFLLVLPANVYADLHTWDGDAAPDNNFSTAANWVGDVAPVADDDVTFNAGAVNCTLDAFDLDQGDFTVTAGYSGTFSSSGTFLCDAVTLDLTNAAWSISNEFYPGRTDNGALTITAGTFTTSNAMQCNGDIALSGTGTINQSASYTAMIGTASKTITNTGGGTITFHKFMESSDTNHGQADPHPDAKTTINADITVNNWCDINGWAVAGDGQLILAANKTITVANSGFNNQGSFSANSGSLVKVDDHIYLNSSHAWEFSNSGTFEWTGSATKQLRGNSDNSLNHFNDFTMSGLAELQAYWEGGAIIIDGNYLQSNGTFLVDYSGFTISGTTTITDGILRFLKNGTLTGSVIIGSPGGTGELELKASSENLTLTIDTSITTTNSGFIDVDWTDGVNTATIDGVNGDETISGNDFDIGTNGQVLYLSDIDCQISTVTLGSNEHIRLSGDCTFDAITLNGDANTEFTTNDNKAACSGGTLTVTSGVVTISDGGEIDAAGQNVSTAANGAITLVGNSTLKAVNITNAGTINLDHNSNVIDITGNIDNDNAIDVAGTSANIYLEGNWDNTGGAFTCGSSTVTFDGTAAGQTLTSDTETYNIITVSNSHADGVIFADAFTTETFNDTTGNSKLTFNAGDTYTITGAAGLNLDGGAAGSEITIISDSAGTQFIFNVTGGSQTVTYVNVKDSAASTNNITANISINSGGNDDGDPDPHWVFGNVTRYWVAAGNSDWDTNANWSSFSGGGGGADYPTAGDTAVFDNGSDFNCTLDAVVSIAVLNVQSGYDGIISCGTDNFTTSGNMTLSDGIYTVGANITRVDGTLTVSGGTGTFTSGAIDANGAVSITGGELIAPSGDFNVAANWSHAGGIFTHSDGTVIFDTAAVSTIANDTTFYDLSCTTAGKTINVTAGTTQTVDNTLTVDGQDSATKITLHSTADNNSYILDFPAGSQTIIYVDLKDCTAGTTASTAYNSIDSTGNTNWTFLRVDPYGVVFDSVSDSPIQGAVVTIYTSAGVECTSGIEIDAADTNPQTTGVDGAYSYNCINGDYYITITANGYAYPTAKTDAELPFARTIVTPGSRGEEFTVAGVVIEMDHPMDPGVNLLTIKKDANKEEAAIGDIVTYTVSIENATASDISNVYIEDKIPPGFKYIDGKTILDGQRISDPTGNRPLTFNIDTVESGQARALKYQLVVGTGVTTGYYKNEAFAKSGANSVIISNIATETVKVVFDPLFDLAVVIGKVFWDHNENGRQDSSSPYALRASKDRQSTVHSPRTTESGIANVQIVMEDGTIVTTGKDGKYHLQAIIPGRHLFRLNEKTLPDGAYLTTDKVVIADITPGLLTKVNFGVTCSTLMDTGESQAMSRAKAPFVVAQERSRPLPRLNVAGRLKIETGKLKGEYEFRIFTNYNLFIKKWTLEILDKDTKWVVKTFRGTKDNIFGPIYWDGMTDDKELIVDDPERTGKNYVYRLRVTGAANKEDETLEKEFDLSTKYEEWLEKESRTNNLEKQTIKIKGETIKIHGLESSDSIRVMKSGEVQAEIPVTGSEGLAAKDLLEGFAYDKPPQVEIILPDGRYDIKLKSERDQNIEGSIIEPKTSAEGSSVPPESYSQHIKVGDDYLFFVGMGDAKAGYTFNSGNIEPVSHDDKFKEGFWYEGKLAYYLKGKVLGKFLITSSLDTERHKKELFRNLDPNKYYPIYGDSSSADYKAADTQGTLYLLIEWDKSSVIWGNYNTAFTDTEFAQFSRTLYGGKVHLETTSATQFGEPHTKLVVFYAEAKQKSAHNEFTGTGGSLYYLKNKDVIEGSQKVEIEVRDKITGLVLASEKMREGSDYEIDYENGRIIFWQPLSYITESNSIISTHLLDGNHVYVVVDYEYEVKDYTDQTSVGARAEAALGDYLSVGGTYVKEELMEENYELRGVDATLHLGKDIKLTAEYAETKAEAERSFISTDGGLNFIELATKEDTRGEAYGLKGEAHLFDNRLGLTGYYKRIDDNFSTSATSSQQGKELIGFGFAYDIFKRTRLILSHDIQKLIDGGNLQARLQVGAKKTETTLAQVVHDMDRLKLTGEYRHQAVTERKNEFDSETNTKGDIVAIRADYELTEKVDVSLEQQAALKGEANYQTTAGVKARMFDWLSLRGKGTVGNDGISSSIGATTDVNDKIKISGDYTRADYAAGESSDSVSLGASAKTDDKTEIHTTYAVTDSTIDGETSSLTFGSKKEMGNGIELVTDKTVAVSGDKKSYGTDVGLAREKDGKRLEATFGEQYSESSTEISNSNIFGLSGAINNRWAAATTFERGIIQNHDGTETMRNAGTLRLGFVDKDEKTGELKLKASTKIELRFDRGDVSKRQYLSYSALERKLHRDTTLFAKANLSQTKDVAADSVEAQYKELVFGTAYRPAQFDWLNLLTKYSYLENDAAISQEDIDGIEKERAHILAGEAVIDLTPRLRLTEKLAYRMGEERVAGFDFTKASTWLWINRLGYNIGDGWQLAGEYRILGQKEAKDQKHGALIEINKDIGDFVQVGVGYNFTDFNDDLTHLDYTAHGPFVRITGKLYERTNEEVERAEQKKLRRKIHRWTLALVYDVLAKPGSEVMKELNNCFSLARAAQESGRLEEAKKYYKKILYTHEMIYDKTVNYITKCIKLDENLRSYNKLVSELYNEGGLAKVKELWARIITESRWEGKE